MPGFLHSKIFYMDPIIGGALIGLGGSLLESIFNSSSQSSANATNIKLAREQRRWNEKMWNKNNAYNTPLAQMQRYAAAGLNPNLIYENGTSGASSSPAQGVDPATVRPNWHLDTNMVGQALQLSSQLKVNDSIAEKNIQDAAKARSEAGVADANKALLAFNLSRGQKILDYELEGMNYANTIAGFNARKQYDRYGREEVGWYVDTARKWAETQKIKADTDQVNKFISQMDDRLRNDTIKAIAAKTSADASVIAARAQRTLASIAGGQLELNWTRNTWEAHRAALQNSVSEADIRNAGALYAKLLAEGRGQELENELTKKYGAIEKVTAIVSSIVNAASGAVNAAANLFRIK